MPRFPRRRCAATVAICAVARTVAAQSPSPLPYETRHLPAPTP